MQLMLGGMGLFAAAQLLVIDWGPVRSVMTGFDELLTYFYC